MTERKPGYYWIRTRWPHLGEKWDEPEVARYQESDHKVYWRVTGEADGVPHEGQEVEVLAGPLTYTLGDYANCPACKALDVTGEPV